MLDLKESNTISYYKVLQKLYKTVKEVDSTTLIICYQPDEEEEEITQKNKVGVGVKTKDALMNYSEAISNYLW